MGIKGMEYFANPYLLCEECGAQVTHRESNRNYPCGHGASFESVCPSWSPVSGCRCEKSFGSVDHKPLEAPAQ